jgi:hypothetical protein
MITAHRLAALLGLLVLVPAPPTLAQSTAPKASTMTAVATGPFEVKLAPQPTDAGPAVGRMSIDKQFKGDLLATSKGEMLSFRSAVEGSAGYVAIEKVTGTLHGRRGTFVLQHSGTMDRGEPGLTVTVVPDSGTEELAGLAGRMDIIIEGGKHSYRFEYSLPEAR